MIRKAVSRLVPIVGLLVGLVAWYAAPAHAAPTPPASVEITGEKLDTPLQVGADDPIRLAAVLEQVNWLDRATHSSAPASADLGPKYTVKVFAGDVAKQLYDLYPLAKGGPRAFRPAKQPDLRPTTSAWFFGRVNMSEALRGVGVPLPEKPDTLSGGIGGGERVIPDEAINPGESLDEIFGELQYLLLLNIGLIVMITAGLAGIALLVRRRTR